MSEEKCHFYICARVIVSLDQETITSNEKNTAVNDFVTTCSSAAPLLATGSAPLTQCNPNKGYEQLTKENHHQYFRHGSPSVAPTSNGISHVSTPCCCYL